MNVKTDHHPDAPPSSLPRIAACPGSMTLCKQVPPESSPDAEEGTLLHSKLPPDAPLDGLDDEQRAAVLWAREHIAAKTKDCLKVEYEKTMVLLLDGWPVTWGTEDVVGLEPEAAILDDAKFGRILVEREGCELTMRCYAGMAMQTFHVPMAKVWVCQPREKAELFGVYTNPEKIAQEIFEIIRNAFSNPTVYNPSPEACRYCRAKVICPAFREEVLSLTTRPRDMAPMPAAEIARALEFCSTVERWVRQMHAVAHQALDAGVEIPGWGRRPKTYRSIPRLDEAFGRLAGILTQEEFLGCCDVGMTKLKEAYGKKAKALGVAKSAAAGERQLFAALGDLIEEKTVQTLSRSKEETDAAVRSPAEG